MKILLGVDRFEYGQGISRVVEQVAKYLFEKGYDTKIVCGSCDIRTKVPILQCKYRVKLRQSSLSDLLKKIRDENPDIFHSSYYPMSFCGALINSKKTIHIMHSHGVAPFWVRSTPKGLFAFTRAFFGEYLGSHFSRKVIAVSKYIQNEVTTKFKVNQSKTEVVYNSVDMNMFNPSLDGSEIRGKYDLKSHEVLLLSVGGSSSVKGHELLIEAVKRVVKKRKGVKLMLVGLNTNNPYTRRIANLISALKLKNYVLFSNFVSNDELPKYYVAADIFVSASKWESFGLPFAEAMASGKPVVGFNTASISELIVNAYNGYKVDYLSTPNLAERMLLLIDDVENRHILGKNARTFAEKHFDLDRNMEKILRIYNMACP